MQFSLFLHRTEALMASSNHKNAISLLLSLSSLCPSFLNNNTIKCTLKWYFWHFLKKYWGCHFITITHKHTTQAGDKLSVCHITLSDHLGEYKIQNTYGIIELLFWSQTLAHILGNIWQRRQRPDFPSGGNYIPLLTLIELSQFIPTGNWADNFHFKTDQV